MTLADPALTAARAKLADKDERYKGLFNTIEIAEAGGIEARVLPCLHLGRLLTKQPCLCWAKDERECIQLKVAVTHDGRCQTCPKYEADE